jgi:ABC-2 type transport system permease protein
MIGALLRLEARSVGRARWFAASVVLSLAVVGFFLVVAARESSVLGFTGFGKVMAGVVQVALLMVPLLALASTAQAITAARQSGVLEWYMANPVTRDACFRALFLPRIGALVLPVVGSVGGLALVAALLGQPVAPGLVATFLAVLLGQALAFGALGMWVSAVSRAPEQALLAAVALWMGTAIFVDFVLLGVLLRWDLPPGLVFLLAGLNPMQDGRIALLTAVDPQMGVLGPVGTWAVATLGAPLTPAATLGWPACVALGAGLAVRRAFLRRDVL